MFCSIVLCAVILQGRMCQSARLLTPRRWQNPHQDPMESAACGAVSIAVICNCQTQHVLSYARREPSRTNDLQRRKPRNCGTDLPTALTRPNHKQLSFSSGFRNIKSGWAVVEFSSAGQIELAVQWHELRSFVPTRLFALTANCDGSGFSNFASDRPNTFF